MLVLKCQRGLTQARPRLAFLVPSHPLLHPPRVQRSHRTEILANKLEDRFDAAALSNPPRSRSHYSPISTGQTATGDYEIEVVKERFSAADSYSSIASLCLKFVESLETDAGGLVEHLCGVLSHMAVNASAFAVGADPAHTPHARAILSIFAFLETILLLQRTTTTPLRRNTLPAIARAFALHTRVLASFAPRLVERFIALLLVYVAPFSALPKPAQVADPSDTLDATHSATPTSAALYLKLGRYLPPTSAVAQRGAAAAALLAARSGDFSSPVSALYADVKEMSGSDSAAARSAEQRVIDALASAPRRVGLSVRGRLSVIEFVCDAAKAASSVCHSATPSGWAHALALSTAQCADLAMESWSTAAEAVAVSNTLQGGVADSDGEPSRGGERRGRRDEDASRARAVDAVESAKASAAEDAGERAQQLTRIAQRRAAQCWLVVASLSRSMASVGQSEAGTWAGLPGAKSVLRVALSTFSSVAPSAHALVSATTSLLTSTSCGTLGMFIDAATEGGGVVRPRPPPPPGTPAPPSPPTVAEAMESLGSCGGVPTPPTALLGLPAWALADVAHAAVQAELPSLFTLCVNTIAAPTSSGALAASHSLRSLLTLHSAFVIASSHKLVSLGGVDVGSVLGGTATSFRLPTVFGAAVPPQRRRLSGLTKSDADSDPAHRVGGGPLVGLSSDIVGLLRSAGQLSRVFRGRAHASFCGRVRPLLEAVVTALPSSLSSSLNAHPGALPSAPIDPSRSAFLDAMSGDGSVSGASSVVEAAEGSGVAVSRTLSPDEVALLCSPKWSTEVATVSKCLSFFSAHPATRVRPITRVDITQSGMGLGGLAATQAILDGGGVDPAALSTTVRALASVARAGAITGASLSAWVGVVNAAVTITRAAKSNPVAFGAVSPTHALKVIGALMFAAPRVALNARVLHELVHDGSVFMPSPLVLHFGQPDAIFYVAVGGLASAAWHGEPSNALSQLTSAALRRVASGTDASAAAVREFAGAVAAVSDAGKRIVEQSSLPPSDQPSPLPPGKPLSAVVIDAVVRLLKDHRVYNMTESACASVLRETSQHLQRVEEDEGEGRRSAAQPTDGEAEAVEGGHAVAESGEGSGGVATLPPADVSLWRTLGKAKAHSSWEGRCVLMATAVGAAIGRNEHAAQLLPPLFGWFRRT